MNIYVVAIFVALNLGIYSCQSKNPKKAGDRTPAQNTFPMPNPQPNPQPQYYVPPAPISKTACYNTTAEICAIEVAIFKKTNAYRLENGKTALQLGEKLSFSSRKWSDEMGQRNRIGHGGFSRERMQDIASEYGSSSGVAMTAENVAMTFSRARGNTDMMQQAERVAESFVNMWIKSRGHRRNILRNTSAIGVGVYRNGSGKYFATQIFGRESAESTIAEQEIDYQNLVRNNLQNQPQSTTPYAYGLGPYRH